MTWQKWVKERQGTLHTTLLFFFFLARLKLFQNESMRELVIALRESDNSEEYEHIEVLEQFSMSVWIGVHGVRRYLNSTKQ
jgi:hypothetical protein